MHDPANPTHAELLEWAWLPDSMAPCQDWAVVIQDLFPGEYLKLAKQPDCPTQRFFLHVLYVWVGDSYRTKNWDRAWGLIQEHLDSESKVIAAWARRSVPLRNGEIVFDYADWCECGIVNADLKSS